MDAINNLISAASATTLKVLYPGAMRDFYFRNSPWMARLRAFATQAWTGGLFLELPFAYQPLIGDAYAKGGTFITDKVDVIASNRFFPRFYYVNLTQFLADLAVFNRGPAAIVDRLSIDSKVGVNTMNEMLAIDFWRHGQGVSGGTTGNSTDRSLRTNGVAEAVNNGVDPSWTGEYFQVYGETDRRTTSAYGDYQTSTPIFCGNSDGSVGSLDYLKLDRGYNNCRINAKEPDIGVGNKEVITLIENRVQPMQRFETVTDFVLGVSGLRMKNAIIVQDDYCPSLANGKSKPTGSFLTSTFSSPATVTTSSRLPASTTITVGETFWWFTTQSWKVTMPDGIYGFNFTGYQRPPNADVVVGQILLAITMYCEDVRLNQQYYGIGS